MDDFVDDEIGENSKLLLDLLRGLKKKEDFLEGQVDWYNVYMKVCITQHLV